MFPAVSEVILIVESRLVLVRPQHGDCFFVDLVVVPVLVVLSVVRIAGSKCMTCDPSRSPPGACRSACSAAPILGRASVARSACARAGCEVETRSGRQSGDRQRTRSERMRSYRPLNLGCVASRPLQMMSAPAEVFSDWAMEMAKTRTAAGTATSWERGGSCGGNDGAAVPSRLAANLDRP
jgi:hypothetical protein